MWACGRCAAAEIICASYVSASATYPSSVAGTTVSGTCNAGYTGSASVTCSITGARTLNFNCTRTD